MIPTGIRRALTSPARLAHHPAPPVGRPWFALDLHIGVVADLAGMFDRRGTPFVDWTLSAHADVMGRRRDPVAVVDRFAWPRLDETMVRRFQRRYSDVLDACSGFVSAYPTAFALLYEGLGRPRLAVAATRYEHPFTHDRARWEWWNERLIAGVEDGTILPVANNRADAAYLGHFTGVDAAVVPSLCDYAPAVPEADRRVVFAARGDSLLAEARAALGVAGEFLVARSQLGRVPWDVLHGHRAIVHVPYQVSTMSFFEQYRAGVPLLVPTDRMLLDLHRRHPGALFGELTFADASGRPADQPEPRAPVSGLDPFMTQDPDVVRWWLDHADFNDEEWFPEVLRFDSWRELASILLDDGPDGLGAVRARMQARHAARAAAVDRAWAAVLG